MKTNVNFNIKNIKISPLADNSEISGLNCGESEIDKYIPRCCDRHSKHRAKVFCAKDSVSGSTIGFYCLSISAVDSENIKNEFRMHDEYHKYIHFLYLNYLAVEKAYQCMGVGTFMLVDALIRCANLANNAGTFGVALNALTPRAATLYDKYGFRQFDEHKYPMMILPVQSLFDAVSLLA